MLIVLKQKHKEPTKETINGKGGLCSSAPLTLAFCDAGEEYPLLLPLPLLPPTTKNTQTSLLDFASDLSFLLSLPAIFHSPYLVGVIALSVASAVNLTCAVAFLMAEIKESEAFASSTRAYRWPLVLVTLLVSPWKANGSAYLTSRIFSQQTSAFSMPWTARLTRRFRFAALLQIFLEDIPQLAVVLWVQTYLDKWTVLNVVTVACSGAAILANVAYQCYKLRTKQQQQQQGAAHKGGKDTRPAIAMSPVHAPRA